MGVQVEVLPRESLSPSYQAMLWMFMGPRKATETPSSKGDRGPLTFTSCVLKQAVHIYTRVEEAIGEAGLKS